MSRHEGVSCDGCMSNNFRGLRYKCLICYDYDLCSECYDSGVPGRAQHASDHSMQCILAPGDIDIYYGGEGLMDIPNNCQSFSCPFCSRLGFSQITLQDHVSLEHADMTNEVVCPICAVVPGGEPNHMTEDLVAHFALDHGSGRMGVSEQVSNGGGNTPGDPGATESAGGGATVTSRAVRRVGGPTGGAGGRGASRIAVGSTTATGASNAANNNRHGRRSNLSAGLAALTSGRDSAIDPIAELLSQLGGMRRGNMSSAVSHIQQLQQVVNAGRARRTIVTTLDPTTGQPTGAAAASSAHHHHHQAAPPDLTVMMDLTNGSLQGGAEQQMAQQQQHQQAQAGDANSSPESNRFLLKNLFQNESIPSSDLAVELPQRQRFVQDILLSTLTDVSEEEDNVRRLSSTKSMVSTAIENDSDTTTIRLGGGPALTSGGTAAAASSVVILSSSSSSSASPSPSSLGGHHTSPNVVVKQVNLTKPSPVGGTAKSVVAVAKTITGGGSPATNGSSTSAQPPQRASGPSSSAQNDADNQDEPSLTTSGNKAGTLGSTAVSSGTLLTTVVQQRSVGRARTESPCTSSTSSNDSSSLSSSVEVATAVPPSSNTTVVSNIVTRTRNVAGNKQPTSAANQNQITATQQQRQPRVKSTTVVATPVNIGSSSTSNPATEVSTAASEDSTSTAAGAESTSLSTNTGNNSNMTTGSSSGTSSTHVAVVTPSVSCHVLSSAVSTTRNNASGPNNIDSNPAPAVGAEELGHSVTSHNRGRGRGYPNFRGGGGGGTHHQQRGGPGRRGNHHGNNSQQVGVGGGARTRTVQQQAHRGPPNVLPEGDRLNQVPERSDVPTGRGETETQTNHIRIV